MAAKYLVVTGGVVPSVVSTKTRTLVRRSTSNFRSINVLHAVLRETYTISSDTRKE